MNLLKTFFATLSISAALVCGGAHAALVSVDWKETGDRAISKDTETNLGWLDLSRTKNLSINQVLSQMGAGGQFEGFRLPTADEVFSLISSLSGFDLNTTPGVPKFVSVNIDSTRVDNHGILSNGHVPTLGVTVRVLNQVTTRGWYLNTIGNVESAYITQRTLNSDPIDYVAAGSSYTYGVGQSPVGANMDSVGLQQGVWLVRELSVADVNAPTSALAVTGLLLLMLRRRALQIK